MKKVSEKQRKEYIRRARVKAQLMEFVPTDSAGRKLCPMCGKLPDYRGLSLMHIKALSAGGRTSKRNCRIACFACHNGESGHRLENIPHGKPVDKPFQMSGFTKELRAFSKETQTGVKRGKK